MCTWQKMTRSLRVSNSHGPRFNGNRQVAVTLRSFHVVVLNHLLMTPLGSTSVSCRFVLFYMEIIWVGPHVLWLGSKSLTPYHYCFGSATVRTVYFPFLLNYSPINRLRFQSIAMFLVNNFIYYFYVII